MGAFQRQVLIVQVIKKKKKTITNWLSINYKETIYILIYDIKNWFKRKAFIYSFWSAGKFYIKVEEGD